MSCNQSLGIEKIMIRWPDWCHMQYIDVNKILLWKFHLHVHGRYDVTCKPPVEERLKEISCRHLLNDIPSFLFWVKLRTHTSCFALYKFWLGLTMARTTKMSCSSAWANYYTTMNILVTLIQANQNEWPIWSTLEQWEDRLILPNDLSDVPSRIIVYFEVFSPSNKLNFHGANSR